MRLDRAHLEDILKRPFVDKIAGLIAVLPFAILLYSFSASVAAGTADMYKIGIALNWTIILVTTAARRAPSKLDLTPTAIFVTAARTYWSVLVFQYIDPRETVRLVPEFFSVGLFLLASFVVTAGRLSLGRSIGFIPAHRGLVTTGAYRFVRHPIHAGSMFYLGSYLLASYSPFTLALVFTGCVFIAAKTLIEERLLLGDIEYRRYCERVPWRYIPGVV